MVVPVGEKLVDYNENFRVFLATRNPFPDLPPDASAIVTEVNFSVTRSGLEGQLLGVTIKHEQPELAARGRRDRHLARDEGGEPRDLPRRVELGTLALAPRALEARDAHAAARLEVLERDARLRSAARVELEVQRGARGGRDDAWLEWRARLDLVPT